MNITRSNERKWFRTKKRKARSRLYPVETITDADYTDDLVLLRNALTQAESILHCLEQAVTGIWQYENLDKTEFMYFKQVGAD